MIRNVALALVLLVCMPFVADAAEDASALAAAKQLFARYVQLEKDFDPKVADLYSDDATIQNRRTYPGGRVKVLTLPATRYKEIIRAAMPLAKAKNDRSSYSEVVYTVEGDGIRIKARRYSELKKYSSPISLLVRTNDAGVWLIFEELSESQP